MLRSAELGCVESYYVLMSAYGTAITEKKMRVFLYDWGVPDDDTVDLLAEELKWAMKGAESNSIRADDCQYRLAEYYEEIRDMNGYQKYLKMAASNGHRMAKKAVVIVGSKKAIAIAVRNDSVTKRNTGLAARLAASTLATVDAK